MYKEKVNCFKGWGVAGPAVAIREHFRKHADHKCSLIGRDLWNRAKNRALIIERERGKFKRGQEKGIEVLGYWERYHCDCERTLRK